MEVSKLDLRITVAMPGIGEHKTQQGSLSTSVGSLIVLIIMLKGGSVSQTGMFKALCVAPG